MCAWALFRSTSEHKTYSKTGVAKTLYLSHIFIIYFNIFQHLHQDSKNVISWKLLLMLQKKKHTSVVEVNNPKTTWSNQLLKNRFMMIVQAEKSDDLKKRPRL